MTTLLRAGVFAAALAACGAFAQANPPAAKAAPVKPPPAKPAAGAEAAGPQPMKGRVKEGLYAVMREHEVTGIPGVPRAAQNGINQVRQCLKKADLERPVQAGEGCSIKRVTQTPAAVSIAMECADGTATDLEMTFDAGGYTSDMKTRGVQDGKPFTSRFRTQAKYVGPACQ